MKRKFGELISEYILKDERIWLLTGDLGFGVLDSAKNNCPERFVNVGAAEQLLLGSAVGLSHNGYIPICYSITPFLIFRPFEYIRNYLDHEKSNVKLVGMGRGKDYNICGFTHWGEDVDKVMQVFPNIIKFQPKNENELCDIWEEFIYNDKPSYLNLTR